MQFDSTIKFGFAAVIGLLAYVIFSLFINQAADREQSDGIAKQAELAVEQNTNIEELTERINRTVDIATSTIIMKQDRNFFALNEASKEAETEREAIGNATLALFLPLILDIDEDTEQLKKRHNVTDLASDLIKVKNNGTHLYINGSVLEIPHYNATQASERLN